MITGVVAATALALGFVALPQEDSQQRERLGAARVDLREAAREAAAELVAATELHEAAAIEVDVGNPGEDASRSAQDRIFADPDFGQFHRVLGRNFTANLFDADNISILVIGSAATVGILPFREEIRDAVEDEAAWLGDGGHWLGSPVTINAATGTMVLIAPFTDDVKFRSFAFTLAQAKILDSAFKYSIKYSVERSRPSGENTNSFPSGHTSGAFMFANVIHHYYGKTPGIISYTVASLVGISRIEREKHFASDVVFGAALGILAAQTAIRGSERAFGDGGTMTLVPLIDRNQRGAMVLLEF